MPAMSGPDILAFRDCKGLATVVFFPLPDNTQSIDVRPVDPSLTSSYKAEAESVTTARADHHGLHKRR